MISGLAAVRAAEASLVKRVAEGLGVPEWVRELHADGRVKEVEF